MAHDSNSSNGENWSLYPYDPNKAAPIAFAVLLFILGIAQIYQSFFRFHWKKVRLSPSDKTTQLSLMSAF